MNQGRDGKFLGGGVRTAISNRVAGETPIKMAFEQKARGRRCGRRTPLEKGETSLTGREAVEHMESLRKGFWRSGCEQAEAGL